MNAKSGALWGAALLAANGSVLGQLAADFDDTNPGSLGSPELVLGVMPTDTDYDGTFQLTISPGLELTLSATYNGTVQVINTGSGLGPADYTVAVQVQLTLIGSGLSSPLVLDLGTVTGTVEDVPEGLGGLPAALGPKSGFVTAALTGVTPWQQGNYQLSWGVSSPVVTPEGGKSGTAGAEYHHIIGGVVPEPAEYGMVVGLGLLGLAVWRRRA